MFCKTFSAGRNMFGNMLKTRSFYTFLKPFLRDATCSGTCWKYVVFAPFWNIFCGTEHVREHVENTWLLHLSETFSAGRNMFENTLKTRGFYTFLKPGLRDGTCSETGGKCTHFYSFSEAKNTSVHKAISRKGWWAHLGRRKCTHFFSSVCVFSTMRRKCGKKIIRKHDHESWHFRSENEPTLNRLLNSFAAEPCPHWENWQHFRRPKWAHFERVPWPRTVFARVQKSW